MAGFSSRGEGGDRLSRGVAAHRHVFAQGATIQCGQLSLGVQYGAEDRRTHGFPGELKLRCILQISAEPQRSRVLIETHFAARRGGNGCSLA